MWAAYIPVGPCTSHIRWSSGSVKPATMPPSGMGRGQKVFVNVTLHSLDKIYLTKTRNGFLLTFVPYRAKKQVIVSFESIIPSKGIAFSEDNELPPRARWSESRSSVIYSTSGPPVRLAFLREPPKGCRLHERGLDARWFLLDYGSTFRWSRRAGIDFLRDCAGNQRRTGRCC